MQFITKSILSFIFTSLIGLFTFKTIKIYFLRKKYAHIPGPPTRGLIGFYMGNLDQAIHVMKNGKILADLINEW